MTLKDPHNPGRLKGMDRSFTDFEKFYTPTSDELRVRHYWTWGRRPTRQRGTITRVLERT